MSIFTRIADLFRRTGKVPTTPHAAHEVITTQNAEPRDPVIGNNAMTPAETAPAISGANVVGWQIQKKGRRLRNAVTKLSNAFHGYVTTLFDAKSLAADPLTAKILRKARLAAEVLIDLKWALKLRASIGWAVWAVTLYLIAVDGLFLWTIFRDAFNVPRDDFGSLGAISAALFAFLTPILTTLMAALVGRKLASLNGQYTLAHARERDDHLAAQLELITEREWTWNRGDYVTTSLLIVLALAMGGMFFGIGLYRFSAESTDQLLGVKLPVELFSVLLGLLPLAATAACWARSDAIKRHLEDAVNKGKKLRKQLDRLAHRVDGTQRGLELAWLRLADLIGQIVAAGNQAASGIEQIILLAASTTTTRDIVAPLAPNAVGGGAASAYVTDAEAKPTDDGEGHDATDGGATAAAWSLPRIEQRLSTTLPYPVWSTDALVGAIRALDEYRPDNAEADERVERLIQAVKPVVADSTVSEGEPEDGKRADSGALVFTFPTEVTGRSEEGGVPSTV